MKAQTCYKDRAKLEFCSGSDLSDFFLSALGDPSPSGKREISSEAWGEFVRGCMAAIRQNSPDTFADIQRDAVKGLENGDHISSTTAYAVFASAI